MIYRNGTKARKASNMAEFESDFRELRREAGHKEGFAVCVMGSTERGHYEWTVEKAGEVVAWSECGYGSIGSALRDGLLFESVGRVLDFETGRTVQPFTARPYLA